MLEGQVGTKNSVSSGHVPKLTILPSFLQLEVLTNLANETNISTILREFQVCHGHRQI